MKLITLIAMLVLATGCAKDADRAETKSTDTFRLETLFNHDGCTVYRFEDVGRYHYFVKCENGSDSTITTHTAGKSSSFPETIQTETVE